MSRSPENVAAFLLEQKSRDAVALIADRNYSYGELSDAAAKVAQYLVASNCPKGDRVLLLSDNSFFWAATYLGILSAGMVCVPVPTTTRPHELQYFLVNTEATLVAIQSKLFLKFESQLDANHVLLDEPIAGRPALISLESLQNSEPAIPSYAVVAGEDLAALMFTSGSTGKPRGVMVTHGNIRANTESIIEYLELNRADRIMTVLPFHYCFGTSLLHTHLRVGGSLVLDQKFLFPEKTLNRMQETECTGFAGVPSHYQVLLRKTTLRKRQFPKLRHVQQAGGYLSQSFQQELCEALPTTKVFIMYGQTEATARLTCLPPEFHRMKLGSIGKAIPGVTISVLSDSGKPVLPGENGEIVAEGENIAKGYWRDPEETAKTFRNGKLFTGDRATVDEDGFIYVVGRAKDFLKCGGTRVSCKQIEDEILQQGELVEAAVVGVQDDLLGEAVKAFVVARPGSTVTESDVRAFCRGRLLVQLVPQEVVFLDSLPKNESGKIVKEQLRNCVKSHSAQ